MTEDEEIEQAVAAIEHGLGELRKLQEEIARRHKRAAFFRKLGVRVPKSVIAARQRLIVRKFDGRGLRRRDRAALIALHWVIDRCEMLSMWGELGDIFHVERP